MTTTGLPIYRRRWLLAGVLVAALAVAAVTSVRAYRAYLLLQSAAAAGAIETGTVRAWMTVAYVAESYGVAASELRRGLGLAADLPADTTLRAVAEARGIAPFDFMATVQRVLADALKRAPPKPDAEPGWYDDIEAWFMGAVLVYGYPAFAAVLALGALGLPVPTGLAATVAGSLAGRGEFELAVLALIAVVASAIGDLAAYGVGRLVSPAAIHRHGRWIGYTAHNRARIETLFARWGPATVLVTRTLASHLSSVASLLAGFHRYRVASFFFYSVTGRLAWTGAYLGAGYLLGGNLEAASRLLGSLSVTLAAAIVGAFAATLLLRRRHDIREEEQA